MDFRNFPELHGDISAIQKEAGALWEHPYILRTDAAAIIRPTLATIWQGSFDTIRANPDLCPFMFKTSC